MTRSSMKKRETCQFAHHDEYEWQVGFFSQEARADFINWSRWIGAAVSESGIAVPSRTAREVAPLMRP